MSKLLNKPFKAFTIYALIILACSIPVYYLVVDFIWLDELDEHNQIIKERIENSFNNAQIEESELNSLLKNWDRLQPNTTLTPSYLSVLKPDSTYTITKQNRYVEHNEIDRFRVLSAYININGKLYHLQIETNIEEADETMLAIAVVTLLFFALLVIGFILLNRRIAKQIWRPFRNTLEKLKSFDLTTQQTVFFDKTDIEEFEELNQSLQKLIDKNISVYNQQKTFIENASHELQTPLAVLKSKLDLLLQNKDLTNEQSEIINAIELPLSRVSRINKNLLLLAKIENNQFIEIEQINISEVLSKAIENIQEVAEVRGLELFTSIEPNIFVKMNPTLCEVLISNFLQNSIRHNKQGGEIQVKLSANGLIVSNSGEPLSIKPEELFVRFKKNDSSKESIGLGLAIVKGIVDLYDFSIRYSFENSMHHFELKFI